MKRIYHPYHKWEEFSQGMWKTILGQKREMLLKEAIAFTGDAELYGSFMMRVIKEWPISCEQNLTCLDMNRKAWIGHAACCLAIGCPEDITRLAWHNLTQKQQDDANAKAQFAIETWEKNYSTENTECQNDIFQMTFFHLLENA